MMRTVVAINTPDVPDRLARAHLIELVESIGPWDDQERAHLATATEWILGRASLYRTRKPDVPATHLVSYFVLLDQARDELLLVAHRKSGLRLPSGGHVEPLEEPWDTVRRECREELHADAVPSTLCGKRPFFLTVTRTRGPGEHTDVSLWYLLQAEVGHITSFDTAEFEAIQWLSLKQVLDQPTDTLDPQMHRFTGKLLAAIGPGRDA
jgi:8-oxo-dGTP pyrophosphatase MutT (NUDIX family)